MALHFDEISPVEIADADGFRPEVFDRWARWVVQPMLNLHPARIGGIENVQALEGESVVFSSTHRGQPDGPIMGTIPQWINPELRLRIIGKAELREIELQILGYDIGKRVARLMDEVGLIPVRRGSNVPKNVVSKAAGFLKSGISIGIFDGGTVYRESQDGRIEDFIGGAVGIASMAKRPIVPMAIAGTQTPRFTVPIPDFISSKRDRLSVRPDWYVPGRPIGIYFGQPMMVDRRNPRSVAAFKRASQEAHDMANELRGWVPRQKTAQDIGVRALRSV